ncbi:nucleoside phosphorylase domain-containing protein [Mycena galopus ATCC 62051]|nr:nucleoside phosphorylase domain-containing protein [Mycena galopus ATCC 62051]
MHTIVAFSAVGSLCEEIAPGDFILPSQLIDRTKGIRPTSFFNGTGLVVHVGFSNPYSPCLAAWLARHGGGTERGETRCATVDREDASRDGGPAVLDGGDLIGMTVLPEAKLAREAEIRCHPHEASVTAAEVGAILKRNVDTLRHVAAHVIERLLAVSRSAGEAKDAGLLSEEAGCMQFTFMAPPAKHPNAALAYVLSEYFAVA